MNCCNIPESKYIPGCEVRENRIQEVTYEKVGEEWKLTYIAKDGVKWWRMMSEAEVHQTKYII